jgi:YHS domain-containing protein
MAKVKTPATFIYSGWNEDETEYIRNEEREIYVGMPCTYGVGTDAYPAFVSRISESGKTVWIKEADWKADVEGGHDYFGNQKYIITPNDNSPEQRVSKRKYDRWMRSNYSEVYFGHARKYEDPHF